MATNRITIGLTNNSTSLFSHSLQVWKWLARDPLKNAERSQGIGLYNYALNNSIKWLDIFGLEVTCVPVGDSFDWKQYIGDKYEIQRQLLRAFALINYVKEGFSPIPDGIDVYLVKWGQLYNVIRQQRYFCTDSCTHKTTVETKQSKISEKTEISYSLDIDTSLK